MWTTKKRGNEMQIKIDPKVVEEELNKSVEQTIRDAFRTYEVGKAIQEQVADKVIGGALFMAINEAIKKVDLSQLTNELAKQMQKTMTSSTILMLREQTVELMFRLSGGNDYDSDKDAKKNKLRTLLANEKTQKGE